MSSRAKPKPAEAAIVRSMGLESTRPYFLRSRTVSRVSISSCRSNSGVQVAALIRSTTVRGVCVLLIRSNTLATSSTDIPRSVTTAIW